MLFATALAALLALATGTAHAHTEACSVSGQPEIQLDAGRFCGGAAGGTKFWLGVPYAEPPTGDLRYRLPQPNSRYTGTHDASAYGYSCLQQSAAGSTPSVPTGLAPAALGYLQMLEMNAANRTSSSEDCLSVNVVVPQGAKKGAGLPVVVWIYGGGFTNGGSSTQNGSTIVARSVELGMPIIYVSLNYRAGALGFPQGNETRAAGVGNLGLQDQRAALHWVNRYIHEFGGDKNKVTIWGESAGAIAVSLHILTNGGDTEGLYRAAWMNSGAPIPTGPIERAQAYWDAYLVPTNCSNNAAVFDCLRALSTEQIQAAMNVAPSNLIYWAPRADGRFLSAPPEELVRAGRVARVPIVSGNVDDEGTLFVLGTGAITTDALVANYLSAFFPKNSTVIQTLLKLYPSDPAVGAPFDTGDANAVTPQWKRLAALVGDLVLTAPRRFFVEQVSGQQDTWVFLSKRFKSLDDFGACHASDLLNMYGPGDMTDYLVRFVTTLDPNPRSRGDGAGAPYWPKYDTASRKILEFLDGATPLAIGEDTYRAEALAYDTDASINNPY